MPGDILLTAKLSTPPLRTDYIPRPRLVARLHEGLERKLTILAAPAGSGKTTLLCEWIGQKRLRAAWVSLDEGDNNHGRFIAYVMAALKTLNTGLDEHIQAVSQAAFQGVPLESQMTLLLNDFAAMSSEAAPIILVLDDYHVIQNPVIHESMLFALEYIPANVHIVVASRTQPPFRLAQMRARRQLNELSAPDLRFSHAETESFLNQVSNLGLSSAQVAALEERTEGWAAGLQLAALALSGRSDVDRFVSDFAGSHRYILDYLADEVFSRQPPEVCDFWLKTSILEKLNADLCNAVTGLENGSAMLNWLQRENLFIAPLDDEGRWYRYHHLFAGLLKNRAKELAAGEMLALHSKAAHWFDANNQPYDAIEHALNAHEFDLAVGMMVKATPALAMRSEMNTMLRWLELLPREMRFTNPRIPLMFAWAHFFMLNIELVEKFISEALHILHLDNLPAEIWPDQRSPQTDEMLAQVFALRTFVAVNQGEPERGIRLAKIALEHLAAGEDLGRFAVLAALGDAYRDADNFAAASQTYSEALALSTVLDQYAASLTMRMDLARLRVKMGQLRHAESICRDVLAWGKDRYHPLFPIAQAYTLLGDILRERGDFDAAEQMILTSIRQCKLAGYQRYLVYSLVSLARLKFARNDPSAAEQALRAAATAAAASGNELLLAWVEQFQVRLSKSRQANWLSKHPLTARTEDSFPLEDETLTLIRLQLNQSKQAEDLLTAGLFLDRMLAAAQKSARTGSAIEVLLLQALTLQQLERIPEALQIFDRALSLAEPEGYVRLFIDEGTPVAALLLLAVQHNLHAAYASRLLAWLVGSKSGENLPYEALTEREAEVLRLLAAGLSNQEIAAHLVVSLSTIKTHITRIFSKLNVTSRTQAIVRATELNLI